ncbi:hypothetical protein QUF79_00280 [Fictibacillus enclensis]|uniref:hypothetical protein n=1 Tax=Fictibacillus enclensis TaxID=1017270 RepID=UPI0025A1630F|nr:hypothetical protein [Fictibacillus enclensis]MDM5196535.1 hypothetical protein [Fictibacillus enclensis]
MFFAAILPNDAIANFQTSWVRYQGDRGQTIKINLYGDKGKIKLLSTEFGIQLSIQDERNETYKWKETEESGEENFRPWRLTPGNEIWKWIDRISSQNSQRFSSRISTMGINYRTLWSRFYNCPVLKTK